MDGETRGLKVDGFGEQSVTGLLGLSGAPPGIQITNTGHPANSNLALARAGANSRFRDDAFTFDSSGQNGHFAPFSWQG
jgi:hypothetical protein